MSLQNLLGMGPLGLTQDAYYREMERQRMLAMQNLYLQAPFANSDSAEPKQDKLLLLLED